MLRCRSRYGFLGGTCRSEPRAKSPSSSPPIATIGLFAPTSGRLHRADQPCGLVRASRLARHHAQPVTPHPAPVRLRLAESAWEVFAGQQSPAAVSRLETAAHRSHTRTHLRGLTATRLLRHPVVFIDETGPKIAGQAVGRSWIRTLQRALPDARRRPRATPRFSRRRRNHYSPTGRAIRACSCSTRTSSARSSEFPRMTFSQRFSLLVSASTSDPASGGTPTSRHGPRSSDTRLPMRRDRTRGGGGAPSSRRCRRIFFYSDRGGDASRSMSSRRAARAQRISFGDCSTHAGLAPRGD